ncbi:MAG TPA: HPP family protein [Nevskiaceae bacterium]|nr:HPP family protein [Nevskiaceae bacterium]
MGVGRAPANRASRSRRERLRALRTGTIVGLVLLVPAATAWLTGNPFIFPSLGPSAYFLVATRERAHRLHHVIVAHLIGVIAGLASYWGLAAGVTVAAARAPVSLAALQLIASGVVSVVLTSAAMKLLHVEHPPACATTLIVSLGLLPSVSDGGFIMLAVVIMALGYRVFLHPRPLL